jgi:hypothetical protein
MTLFQRKGFIGAGGQTLTWKVECDALADEDWLTLASIAKGLFGLRPSNWLGIPSGGLPLAEALSFVVGRDIAGERIVVDDVLTTGATILRFVKKLPLEDEPSRVLVAFDRRTGLRIANLIHGMDLMAVWRLG